MAPIPKWQNEILNGFSNSSGWLRFNQITLHTNGDWEFFLCFEKNTSFSLIQISYSINSWRSYLLNYLWSQFLSTDLKFKKKHSCGSCSLSYILESIIQFNHSIHGAYFKLYSSTNLISRNEHWREWTCSKDSSSSFRKGISKWNYNSLSKIRGGTRSALLLVHLLILLRELVNV